MTRRRNLQKQLQQLRDYANKHKLAVTEEVSEIASGLNGRRRKLLKLLKDSTISFILVEHRDRLKKSDLSTFR